MLIDHFEDTSKPLEVVVEKEVEKIVEKPVEVERNLNEKELIVSLNPVQFKALSKPLEHKRFIEISNKEIHKRLKERSFWSESLKYPGFFSLYDQNNDHKHNMGLFLANTYMSAIVNGMLSELLTSEQVKALIKLKENS